MKIPFISHVTGRRKALRARFDVVRQMSEIEETCIPSYLHPNLLAASVAWIRLFAAAKLYRRFAPPGNVLDFGAATGEIAHVLPAGTRYEFVEINEDMAKSLINSNPYALRVTLDKLEIGRYATIFALDSLEHNDNFASILTTLSSALAPGGVLIISGPTENALYRLGRRVAGFSGAYHKTTIYRIEEAAAERLHLVHRHFIPPCLPLFSLSCWRISKP